MIDPTKGSMLLGIFVLILLTAYSSFSNIITQVYEQTGNHTLGPILLSMKYLSFMFFNMFSPSIRWKYKSQMLIGAFSYSLTFFVGFIFIYVPSSFGVTLTILAAIFTGFGSAIMWTSIGGYLHDLCDSNQINKLKGKYFGIFSGMHCLQGVTGAFITTFCLGLFTPRVYFLIITFLSILAVLFCQFAIKNLEYTRIEQDNQNKICQQAKKMLKFYPKMKHSLPIIFFNGAIIAFVNSSLTHLIPSVGSDKSANVKAGLCFAVYGVGSILGGYCSGFLTDRMKIRRSGILIICLFLFTLALSSKAIEIGNFSYVYICLVFFFWGLSRDYSQGWILILCSKIYQGNLSAFAINKQFHSLSFILYQFVLILTKKQLDFNRQLLPIFLIMLIPILLGLSYIKQLENNSESSKLIQVKSAEKIVSNDVLP